MSWVQRVRQVLPATWELRVVWVLLVLPVLLVLLAVWASLDPQVRQALLGWLRSWLPQRLGAPA